MLISLSRTVFKVSSQIHTSVCHHALPGKAMRKVMGATLKRKKQFSETPLLPTPSTFSKGSIEGKHSPNSKRTSVLNKIFMRHITDLMATGEYSSEFLGHGIEICKVQISPDYRKLNVFWVAKGNDKDQEIDKILTKNAGFLRNELSTLRVMGVVPKIYFVKDKQYTQLMEVDIRLAKADFGEDYVPTDLTTKLKTQLQLHTELSTSIKEKIKVIDKDVEDDYYESLPQMPQDVFGLNYTDIMNRINKAINKSHAAHRLSIQDDSELLEKPINEHPINYLSNKEQKEAFREFLRKREILRSKMNKVNKNYIPDVEYIKEELRERHEKELDHVIEVFENDYISDDEEINIKDK